MASAILCVNLQKTPVAFKRVQIGDKFGRLTVISRAGTSNKFSVWLCRCDCGVTKEIRGVYLTKGEIVSCGCYHKEVMLKHGRRVKSRTTRDATYLSFVAMKGRVLNPNNPAFHNYGGRGIQICEEWIKGGFQQFLSDMGERPPNTSLDRIDNDGNYSASNCKWSSAEEQARNRRGLKILSCHGRDQCVAAWARELKTSCYVIRKKLREGLTMEEIVDFCTNSND
jgi:hypothetical protein